jgi:hypothetical protein
VGGFGSGFSAFNRFQQRHRSIGFPLAVLQKYADDQGGYHAATITYYGFFGIFPLLLVLTTMLIPTGGWRWKACLQISWTTSSASTRTVTRTRSPSSPLRRA